LWRSAAPRVSQPRFGLSAARSSMPRTCRPFWIGLQNTPSALAPRADRALLAERPPYLAASFFRSFRCGTNGLHGSRPLEQAWSSRRPSGATRPCPACWSPSPQAGGIPPLPCGTVLHRCRPWGPLKVHGRAGSNPGCHPDKAADRGGLTLSRLIATKGRRSTARSMLTSIIGALHLGQVGRSIGAGGMADDRP
jgi:hypothetical protein